MPDPVSATIGSAAIGAGSSIFGASQSSKAAKSAAAQQAQAAREANALQDKMYQQLRSDLSGYAESGRIANNALMYLMGLSPQSMFTPEAASGGVKAPAAVVAQPTPSGVPTSLSSGKTFTRANGQVRDVYTSEGLARAVSTPEDPAYFTKDGMVYSFTYRPAGGLSGGALVPTTQAIGREEYFTPGSRHAEMHGVLSKAPSTAASPAPSQQTPADSLLTSGAVNIGNFTKTPGSENSLFGYLAKPVTMDQDTLEKTPGYQFNLTQGLRAAHNAAAARGLGSSGAALKGAEQFATGLADNTYQQQFGNALTNQTNLFNRLMSLTSMGQSSAAQTGTSGLQTGENMAANLVGAANAGGAAKIASANAWGSVPQNAMMMSGMYGNSGKSGSNGFFGNLSSLFSPASLSSSSSGSVDFAKAGSTGGAGVSAYNNAKFLGG